MKRFVLIMLSIFTCAIATAATETINWYVDGNTYATNTCQTGGDITLPQTPTKYGYTFNGWVAYTPIEYLEFTGTQKISASGVLNKSQYFHIKMGILTSGTAQLDFLSAKNFVFNLSPQYGCCAWIPDNNYCNRTSISTGIKYNIEYICTPTNLIIKVNNNSNQINANYDLSSGQSTNFGAINYALKPFYGKIYYAQYFDENNELLADFIPVLDENGTPCMFDKVEGKFYYNAGTGQFIAGPIINQ